MSTVTSTAPKRNRQHEEASSSGVPNILTDTMNLALKKRKLSVISDSDSECNDYSDDSPDDSSSDEDLLQKISKSKISPVKQPKKKPKPTAPKNSPVEQSANAITQVLSGEMKKKPPLMKTDQQPKSKKQKKFTATAEQKLRKSLYIALARLQAVAPEKCSVKIDC
jgi:hypothetical protein